MIKASIPPELLLKWFLKSLLPYISKDVSTSRVTIEEEVIFKDQKLDMIYSQSGIMSEIISDVLQSNIDPTKPSLGLHADDIEGSVKSSSIDLVSNKMRQLSIQDSMFGPSLA
jgi:hypothetical protein